MMWLGHVQTVFFPCERSPPHSGAMIALPARPRVRGRITFGGPDCAKCYHLTAAVAVAFFCVRLSLTVPTMFKPGANLGNFRLFSRHFWAVRTSANT